VDEAVTMVMEVAGCPTTCLHCWAQGGAYATMPTEDALWTIDAVLAFAASRDAEIAMWPMHEVVAHPEAPRLIRRFAELGESFEPLTTTAVPLARRDDWRDVLDAARETGSTTVWTAVHGDEEEHDRRVCRPGGLAETALGVARARDAGFRIGSNVFLTKANVARFDRLLETLLRLELDQVSFEVESYLPTARHRREVHLRPELDDLLPVADAVLGLSGWHPEQWSQLADWTEGAFVARASDDDRPRGRLELVCRPNLDVHSGLAGAHGVRHGNLRADGVEPVLERALASGPICDDEVFVPGLDPPATTELAARWGVLDGREIHFSAGSARNRWLDRMAA
jgi:hypothetical protein